MLRHRVLRAAVALAAVGLAPLVVAEPSVDGSFRALPTKQDPVCITVTTAAEPANGGTVSVAPIADNPCTDADSFPAGTVITVNAVASPRFTFYQWRQPTTAAAPRLDVPVSDPFSDVDGDGSLNNAEAYDAWALKYLYSPTVHFELQNDSAAYTAFFAPTSSIAVVDEYPIIEAHNTGRYPGGLESDGTTRFFCGTDALAASNRECHGVDGGAIDLHGRGGEAVVAAQTGTLSFSCKPYGGTSVNIVDERGWNHAYTHLDAVCLNGEIVNLCAGTTLPSTDRCPTQSDGVCERNGSCYEANYSQAAKDRCARTRLRSGDRVTRGTFLGFLGRQGSSFCSNPHIHYEVIRPVGTSGPNCTDIGDPFALLRRRELWSCRDLNSVATPGAPTSLVATPSTIEFPLSTVGLSWSASGADAYRVELRDASGTVWWSSPANRDTRWTVDLTGAEVGQPGNSYAASNTFQWSVVSFRQGVPSSPSTGPAFTLDLTPPPPTGLTPDVLDNGSISLTWASVDPALPGDPDDVIGRVDERYDIEIETCAAGDCVQADDAEGWGGFISGPAPTYCGSITQTLPSCQRSSPGAQFRWRVRASHAVGTSSPQTFTGEWAEWSYYPEEEVEASIDEPFDVATAIQRFDFLGGAAAAADPTADTENVLFGFFIDLVSGFLTYALEVQATIDEDTTRQQIRYRPFVRVVPGAVYELAAQVKKENVDNPRILLEYYDAGFRRLGVGAAIEARGGSSAWGKVRDEITVPATFAGAPVRYARVVLEARDKKRTINNDPTAPGRTLFDDLYFSREITPSNDRPVIVSTPVPVGREGRRYTYDVDAVDSDPIAYTLDGRDIPAGMTIDRRSGLIVWDVPAGAAGDYKIIVRASDFKSSGSQTYTLSIVANTPPQIVNEGTAPRTVQDAGTWRHQVMARDLDGDPLGFSLGTAPSGMTIDPDTGAVEWTAPPFDPSSSNVYYAEVVVSDGLATDFEGFFIKVLGPGGNTPPEITNAGEAAPNVVQKSTWVHRIDAVDADADPLMFRLSVAPEGATIDPLTGEIEWLAPRYQANGSNIYYLEAVVDDGFDIDIDTIFVRVLKSNTGGPMFTDTASIRDEMGDGQTYRHRLTADDPDSTPLTFRKVSGPFDLEVDRYTGEIAWPTDNDDIGRVFVTVEVTDGETTDLHSFTIQVQFGLDMGLVPVGGAFTRPYFLTSNGGSPVVTGSLRIRDEADVGDFSIPFETCSNRSLAPGERCQVDVRFAPLSVGEKWIFVEIPTNVPGVPLAIAVPFGVGVGSEAAAAPPTDGFGAEALDASRAETKDGGPSLRLIRP